MAKTSIEWTEDSWNPIVGCTIVSPGCTHCYAMAMAARLERMGVPHYAGLTQPTKAGPVWTGKLALAPEQILLAPLRRRKPTTWFVNSMGDLFHEDVPDEWIDKVFAVMALAPQHTFQVLTKRAARMRAYFTERHTGGLAAYKVRVCAAIDDIVPNRTDASRAAKDAAVLGPLPNVWLGVSAEDQRRADERIPDLLAAPAAVRFVSAEPLLGPIDFSKIEVGEGVLDAIRPRSWLAEIEEWRDTSKDWEDEFLDWFDLHEMPTSGNMWNTLDWIIVGGESGPKARPMHPDWVRSIRDQCAAAGTAFFFKQWGEWQPRAWCRDGGTHALNSHPGHSFQEIQSHPDSIERVGAGPDWVAMAHVGKKRAGRRLDGVEHNAVPERADG